MAKWEAEFHQMMGTHREADIDYDFDRSMQSAWQQGAEQDHSDMAEPLKFDSEGIPILGDYVFGACDI